MTRKELLAIFVFTWYLRFYLLGPTKLAFGQLGPTIAAHCWRRSQQEDNIYSHINDATAWDFTSCGHHNECEGTSGHTRSFWLCRKVLRKVHFIARENLHEAQMRPKNFDLWRHHHAAEETYMFITYVFFICLTHVNTWVKHVYKIYMSHSMRKRPLWRLTSKWEKCL